MIERLARRHVVLLGIGHTNAHVLRMWGMNPYPDTDLTCVSDHSVATYSGMLPAVLAGQHPVDAMEIDLVRLCSSVGARLICDRVTGIDREAKELSFQNRPSIPFDALSIGIGSVPATGGLIDGESRVLKIKPMQSFLQRLDAAVQTARQKKPGKRLRFLIVGGGVAGTEIAFCLAPFARSAGAEDHSIAVVTRSEKWLPEVIDSTHSKVIDEMSGRDIHITTGRGVTQVRDGVVDLDDGSSIEADIVIWATGAVAPDALGRFDLPLDDRGFLSTDATLRTVTGDPIFAVGDTGTITGQALPKAGVYAVRQGPVLWENLRRTIDGGKLEHYTPQTSFMKLINLGDGTAIGQWKGMSFSGGWVMNLKNRIDVRFMEKFLPRPMMSDGDEMQCKGCGCKLGGDLLESALGGYENEVKLEDAAEIGGEGDDRVVASTDFFSSPLSDAFLAGRIASLHAASDIVASGARPTHALANVVIPEGDGRSQRRALQDFLAGARGEFDAMGASIVGGHTIVGPRMEVGFTVIGRTGGSKLIRKENLVVGDQLLLTKPLGIGILLAAHMRSRCHARDYDALIEAMLLRQHEMVGIAAELGLVAGTDVTGFGLAGHLLEMLDSSRVGASVRLDDVPLLPGVEEYLQADITSSLAPDNRRVSRRIKATTAVRERFAFDALFDPQTCGGLLLGIASEKLDTLLESFARAGFDEPALVGKVIRREDDVKPLSVE